MIITVKWRESCFKLSLPFFIPSPSVDFLPSHSCFHSHCLFFPFSRACDPGWGGWYYPGDLLQPSFQAIQHTTPWGLLWERLRGHCVQWWWVGRVFNTCGLQLTVCGSRREIHKGKGKLGRIDYNVCMLLNRWMNEIIVKHSWIQ